MNSRYYFLSFIFLFFSCKKENKDLDLVKIKQIEYEITNSDLQVYQKCLDLIIESHDFESNRSYLIDTSFAYSTLKPNYGEYLYENINNSIADKNNYMKILSLIDNQINGMKCSSKRLKLKTPLSVKKPNSLVTFSKPNSKYITACMSEIYWKEDKYIVDNSIQYNMLFILENNEIKKYHNSVVMFN